MKWHWLTGGEDGLLNIPRPDLDGWALSRSAWTDNVALFYFVLAVGCWSPGPAVAAGPLAFRPRSAGDSPERDCAPLRRLQRVAGTNGLVFIMSASIAGLAGGLFAMAQESAYPDVMSLHASGLVVMMTLSGGGSRQLLGAVIGAWCSSSRAICWGGLTETWLLWYGLMFMVRGPVPARGHRPEWLAGLRASGKADAPAAAVGLRARCCGGKRPWLLFEARNLHKRFGDRVVLEEHQPDIRGRAR